MKESSKPLSTQPAQNVTGVAEKINSKISLPEAKDALLRSGYILEHRVENFLRDRDWFVETNTPYRDPETEKSRELDVYAYKVWEIGKGNGTFTAVILAECVNNTQPLAFITKEDKYSDFFGSHIKLDFALDESFYQDELQSSLADFLGLSQFHHYCFGRVVTQYCSFVRKEKGRPAGEWMATHDETHFGCFTTLIKALEQHLEAAVPSAPNWVNGIIIYPMLVLQGDLIDVRLDGKDLTMERVSHVKHRRSVIWKSKETDYMIDVVAEKGLEEFFLTIEQELVRALDCIRANINILKSYAKSEPLGPQDSETGPIDI